MKVPTNIKVQECCVFEGWKALFFAMDRDNAQTLNLYSTILSKTINTINKFVLNLKKRVANI